MQHRSRAALAVATVTAALLPLAVPATAGAETESGELTVSSSVVPLGTPVPSLAELHATPARATAVLPGEYSAGQPKGALEMVGPAAKLGKLSDPSARPNPPSAASLRAGSSTPYPEPPHTMTAKECFDKLDGTGKDFYVKSRFAVCSGAVFTQVWAQNKKPVGESRFVIVAMSTIAKSSRAIDVHYDYLHLDQTGRTGTSGMMISPSARFLEKWPATATIRESGSIPGPRSWAALKADPAPDFTHTLTADTGVGRGKDDAVFAAYQPKVNIKFPAGWSVSGARSGEPFFLAPRWDKAPYLPKSKATGAAVMSYLAGIPFSTKQGAKEKEAADHIKMALTKPGKTQPSNTAKSLPGAGTDRPLNRLYYDETRRDDNRAEAVKTCKAHWGKDYSQGNKYQCDEFPFATTYQGAAQALPKYDPQGKAPKKNFSAMPITTADNLYGGNILSNFYRRNRIIDGSDDGFFITLS
ncbi:hypothetical protein GCM10017688_65170 [Streptomyces ramulosus]